MLPGIENLRICFAHPAYQLAERFAARRTGISHVQVRTAEDLAPELPETDVLVVSLMWKNDMVVQARNLKFIQSISAGIEQFDQQRLRERGIRLANSAGVSAQAVAEHAMALMLALRRRLHLARDDQAKRLWRGMSSHIPSREDELAGKTLLIVGFGRIGSRLAKLARAFDMRVVAVRRDLGRTCEGAHRVDGPENLLAALPAADVVALCCPLTSETAGLIGPAALAAMKPTAHLINVARGPIVQEGALIAALQDGRLAAAALDVALEEPLTPSSPLWGMPNVLITPHKAGETQRFEDGVIDILMENVQRLWQGERALLNQIV